MKFIIVLSTVFSVCCCSSDLSPSLGFPYETSEWRFHPLKQKLLNNKVTDEEILRCRYFMDKISEELDLISSQEELQDILSQCDLLLQKGITYQTRKDDDIKRLPPFEYNNYEPYDFITIADLTTTSSVEENNKNTRPFEDSSPFLVTEQYEASSTKKQTDEPENPINTYRNLWSYLSGASDLSGNSNSVPVAEQNDASKTEKQPEESENPSPINTNWSLWGYLSGASESSGSSSSVPVAEQNDGSKTEKQPEESDVEITKYDTAILNPIDMSVNLWSFFYSFRNSSDSSNENRSEKIFGKDQIAELGIDYGNSQYLRYRTTEIPTVWNIIMPGTKWCGAGSAAKNDDDLGYFENVDRCCRAHDKCNDLLLPGESKYNLENTSPFTVLNCKCDDEMHDCLSQINSVASNAVGQAYFNIFGRMCYTLDYPRKCKTYNLLLGCQEFEVDKTAEKVYQWKPTRKYLTMPFK